MNVLVVEDNALNAETIKECLEVMHQDAAIAASGGDALKQIKRRRFDLVLLDINLPDCMGHHIIPELRKMYPDIRIVTMTGYNSRELELEVRKKGVDFYMIKPFDVKVLGEIVDHLNKHWRRKCWRKP